MNCMKPIISFVILLLSLSTIAQYNIEPGKGFQKIYPGMSTADLRKELGSPDEIVPYEKEKKIWEDFGYDVEQKIVFFLGFTEVYVYDSDNAYSIWKVFVKDDKVTVISMSSYDIKDEYVRNITIDNQLKYFASGSKIKSVLGSEFYDYTDNMNNQEYYYFKYGIRFIMDNDQLRNIFLFQPMTAAQQKKFIKRLENN